MGPITGPFLSVLRTMLVTIAAIFFGAERILATRRLSVASRSVVESCFNACFAKWLAYKPHLARIRSAPLFQQWR